MLQRTLTVEMIQNLYSSPRPVTESSIPHKDDRQCIEDGEYCVGGAFMLMAWHMGLVSKVDPFPAADALDQALSEVFGGTPDDWYETACSIAAYNDTANFDEAWSVLDQVLKTHEPL